MPRVLTGRHVDTRGSSHTTAGRPSILRQKARPGGRDKTQSSGARPHTPSPPHCPALGWTLPDRRPPRQQPSPWGPWLTERPSARAPAQVLCILGNHPHPTPPPTPDKQVAVMQEGCPTVGGVARWEPGETLCLCLS